MRNILEVGTLAARLPGRETLPIGLGANYQGRAFALDSIRGRGILLYHFSPIDGMHIQGELNAILLVTTGQIRGRGVYRATGATSINNAGAPNFYQMGADLKIKVTPEADKEMQDFLTRVRSQETA